TFTAPAVGGTVTLSPGYYKAGITLAKNATIIMKPGVYSLGGAGLVLSSGASLQATNSMIYVAAGALDIDGAGAVNITPPASGAYRGVSIFQARTDATDGLLGAGAFNIKGTIYLPKAFLHLAGNGPNYGNQLIVDRLQVDVGANIHFDYAAAAGSGSGNAYLAE
ncbi:MAG: hypothetical protein WCK05_17175, partial [Planctomycetota bacterium]